ncbi:MAG: hypothetical protein K0S76_732 [Herbinix sp.]|jgi:hypothetical protein|nr:hypothetical protein [Herbinix sp.]
MSIKSNLVSIYNSYKRRLTDAISQVNYVMTSGEYTIDGQHVQLEAINRSFINDVTFFKNQALGYIDQAEQIYKDSKKYNTVSNLKNGEYQAGLANVLKILETGTMEDDDFSNIIEVYKNDSIALNAIKTVVLKNERMRNMSGYIPTNDLDQINAFEVLRKNTKKYTTEISMYNKSSLDINAKMLLAAVDNLDDNLLLK